jgi:predicted RNA-binding Zn-ribbon protein involved in translation (DUF1610 family)
LATDAERTEKPKTPKKNTNKPKKPHPIKFCPKCGSTEIFWAQGLPQLWSIWQCHNCGYQGSLILEDSETVAAKLQEKWQKQNHPAKP